MVYLIHVEREKYFLCCRYVIVNKSLLHIYLYPYHDDNLIYNGGWLSFLNYFYLEYIYAIIAR